MPGDSSSSKVKFPPWKFYESREIIFIFERIKNSFPSSSKWREVIRETNCQQLARIQSGFEGTMASLADR